MNKSYYNAESNLIAKRLRQLRKERGFSQEELAAQLQLLGVDINQPLISKIERNRRFVKDYELACLCRHLSRVNAQKSKNNFQEARMRAISSRKSCSEHR